MSKTYTSLDDFYTDAENHDGNWVFETNLSKRLSNLSALSKEDEVKSKIECERLVLNFSLQTGNVKPADSSTSKEGEVFQYPDYDNLSDSDFEYLSLRSEKVENLYLIVKYNHVLWGSPKKHKKYAERAIDTYFNLFIDLIDDELISTHQKVSILENLIVTSFQADYRVNDAKDLLSDVLFKDDFWKHGWRVSIVDFMLNQK